MKDVLIIFAHPVFEKSRVHRLLVPAVQDLPGVTFHDLYETYPDFNIDVPREQALLEAHDVVVLQHPIYWYSTPPLVKQWFDLVLQYGWAYGTGATALTGKTLLHAVSAAGSQESYQPEGTHQFTFRQLLIPVERTFRLCQMNYLPPFVIFGSHYLDQETLTYYAQQYQRTIESLRNNTLNIAKLEHHDIITNALAEILPVESAR